MKENLQLIIIILLLMLFYLGLPELDKAKVGRQLKPGRKLIEKADFIIMACLLLFSSAVGFFRLGNTGSPQTFCEISGKQAILTLSEYENRSPSRLAFFTGVGTGTYYVEYSEDGENYVKISEYEQDYSRVLRWDYVTAISDMNPRFIRITANGDAYLGEIGVLDEDEEFIPFTCNIPELCDEQEYLCTEQNYMNSTYFDEIYHARTAWEHMNGIYPYEVSHPPLGKLIIAIGISLFGMTPFGWRFSGTLCGALMVPVMYIFAKKLFGSRNTAACTAMILATDFMHLVQTRISTIDSYSVFFILVMYMFMYFYLEDRSMKYLALSGIFFGFGAATKWICLYAGAGLAVLWLADRIMHRSEGIKALMKNIGFCLVFFVLIPCGIYYLSYIPYGTALRIKSIFSTDYFRTVVENQKFMFSYHSNLVAEHPYSSKWYQWVLNIRPVLYYLQYFDDGTRSSFGTFLNPLLCWGGLVAIVVLLYCALFRKERKAAFLLVSYFAQLIPWMFVTRLTFEYHYFACSIFLTLALGYIFSLMENGTKHCRAYIFSFTGVSAALFAMFFPVLTGIRVNSVAATGLLQWLKTWPF